jgi:hypothetical protein
MFFSGPPSLFQRSVVANEQGGVREELVNGNDRTDNSMTNNPLLDVGGWCAVREKDAEWMRIAPVCVEARSGRSEHPKEKVSLHTVRPGTLGLTLLF